ncbi:MAG: YitT family protein, partial [Christensenellaceae bacterium]|nr:YitT family protein [Christensenellaceae bacterium]
KITSVIVGAMLTGMGLGMILRAASTSGGLDIVGIYFAKKSPGLSVGKIAIIVNTTIYIISALLFDLSTAIYSLIYSVLTSSIMDYFHLQNRNSSAFIITKNMNINTSIINELKRGTTIMDGIGGYTKEGTKIILTAVSKYQKRDLNRIIQENDPGAFVIYSENCEVLGHFEKRFDE